MSLKIIENLRWTIFTLAACFLVGCASHPSDRTLLYQDMYSVVSDDYRHQGQKSRYNLQKALSYFEQLDDFDGQWLAHNGLCNIFMAENQHDLALNHAKKALHLAVRLANPERIYNSAIQMGQLTNASHYFEQALVNSSSDIEKALALILLQDFDAAQQLYSTGELSGSPDQLGHLFYNLGKHQRDLTVTLKAHNQFQQADNIHGIVDSLFLAAQLSEQGDTARDFAQRALLAAKESKDGLRSQAITLWLSQQQ